MTALRGVLGLRSTWTVAVGLLIACAVAMGAPLALASDQPDQLITGSKLIIKSNSGDPSKNKLVFVSKDDSFELPSPANDPTSEGAVLHVVDLGQPAGTAALVLVKERWTQINGGFKYKGQAGDPCRTVTIKDDRLVKVVCKGASVALSPPLVGAAALTLEVGTTSIRYCATFTMSTVLKNQEKNGKGIFKAKNAPAPASCLSCGNGTLDAGEQCDDGNNMNNDCCSATCQFEAGGAPCSDGDACTQNDQCNGNGSCGSVPVCGNGAVDVACGEQCDPPIDSACPGLCMIDCTCLSAPDCDGDPSRNVFIGAENACNNLNNQALCEDAFVLNSAGVTSCWWDGGECLDCTPSDQADAACVNTCHPPVCNGDPARTTFVGGPESPDCSQFDGNQSACQTAFGIGENGVTSCFYDTNTDECLSCEASNQENGDCTNSCATCDADPTRTVYAGGPNTSACTQFDGNPAVCESAFHRTQCGTTASCFYDPNSGDCRGCGPQNESDGSCTNTCVLGPSTCTQDPARTIFAGGPFSQACHQHDGDPLTCQQAYHRDQCGKATSCFYDFNFDECRGCGPTNRAEGLCVNSCASGPVACENDPSRTVFTGMPQNQGCRDFGLVVGTASCEIAFTIGRGGAASCFYDSGADDCRGCGPPNEADGECINTCRSGPVACPADPTRTVFAGGPQTSACRQFDGDQPACESAFHLGLCGVASCFYSGGDCLGCGAMNELNGSCSNTCNPPSCPGDISRTIFAGGPQTSACHQFDGNQPLCAQAFHLGQGGVASCYYDVPADECRGCGPSNQENGDCVNSCPTCTDDGSRTFFAGDGLGQGCEQFDGNEASCETAFNFDECRRPTSCHFDSGTCIPCGPNEEGSFECIETCTGGPPVCAKDPSRTLFAGVPNTAACHQYDGNPTSCAQAFHQGADGFASCFYDFALAECLGCGTSNESSNLCVNTCRHGPPPCVDTARTIFVGGPDLGSCAQFDGNPTQCGQAYHLDDCYNPSPCFYASGSCLECGLDEQQDGECFNSCRTGPATCGGDTSRTVFAGLPQSSACHTFDSDPIGCLSAFHLGQCGVASCYYTGASCQGCGPNNLFSQECFDTCAAP